MLRKAAASSRPDSKSLDAQARYDEDTPLAKIVLESQDGKKAPAGDLSCTALLFQDICESRRFRQQLRFPLLSSKSIEF
ncbi:hypothetical protein BSQ97_15925 [Serratia proteamaculans]|nr:hypothetical protein F8R23_01245 [Serratia proteamaculans]RYM50842.1 hypothetical protein BSQ97_15925 [Serratia proteamaculans]RYM56354.1 hypothetical protein BSQ96_06600 [Serratia proteamaculans]